MENATFNASTTATPGIMTTTTTDFIHTPLPNSTTHIRLLEILSVEDPITCQLSTFPLDNAPSYYALSYTWGSAAHISQITINHAQMRVRQNCANVLYQAYALLHRKKRQRGHDRNEFNESDIEEAASSSRAQEANSAVHEKRYFWIDAICIDQNSLTEKNHQVALMGSIYTHAAHVYACIGPHTRLSNFLHETFFPVQKNLLGAIHRAIRPSSENRASTGRWVVENPIPNSRWLALQCFFAIGKSTRKKLIRAFMEFMQRGYFSRVWVLQELHLATRVSYCCGEDVASFDDLLALSMLIDFWVNDTKYYSSGMAAILLKWMDRDLSLLPRRKACKDYEAKLSSIASQRGCLALASGTRGPRRLAEVLDAMREFQCADVRDKLYGVLSLIEWHKTPVPVPDYEKDTFEIAKEVLQIFLEESESAPITGSAIQWAQSLYKLFNISDKQNSVQNAIEKRLSSHVEPRSKGGRPSKPDNTWAGTRLSWERPASPPENPWESASDALSSDSEEFQYKPKASGSSRPPSKKNPHPSTVFPSANRPRRSRKMGSRAVSSSMRVSQVEAPSLRDSRTSIHIRRITDVKASTEFVQLVDEYGNHFVFAPKGTQQGDWYVTVRDYRGSWQTMGIIIRPVNGDETKKFQVMGQTSAAWECMVSRMSITLEGQRFNMHWEAEDVLILNHWFEQRPELDEGAIEEWLRMGICGREGSSYATVAPKEREPRWAKTTTVFGSMMNAQDDD